MPTKSLTTPDGGAASSDRRGSPSFLSILWIVALNSVVLLTLQQLIATPASPAPPQTVFSSESPGRSIAHPSAVSPYGAHIPRGRATPLPSVRITADEDARIDRKFYGGAGDKQHLGGFTSFDPSGVSTTLWKHMMNHLGIRSLLDLGCGRGISTSWFVLHGLEYVVCAEGSHDAVEHSFLPTLPGAKKAEAKREEIMTWTLEAGSNVTEYELVEHDFSRGAWWPDRTVDVAWSVEFTEHVGRNFMMNYHTAFRKAALIFATHSNWGGWHHVEVHDDNWWRIKMESSGFIYSEALTKEMRNKALQDHHVTNLTQAMIDKGKATYAVGQHLRTSLQVFINPLVASLPEHQHLFAEHGCYSNVKGKECGKEVTKNVTPLPNNFKPLKITEAMDKAWLDIIRDIPLP